MYSSHKWLATFLLACVIFAFAKSSNAQLFDQKTTSTVNSDLVPSSTFFALSAKPELLVKNPKLSAFPREVVSAAGIQQLGFDPMLIEEVTVLITDCEAGGFEEPPRYAIIMRFSQMQGLAGKMIEGTEETNIRGFKAYLRDEYPDLKVGFLIYDESTILFGESTFLNEVVSGNSGPVAKLMKNKSVNGEIMGFLDMESFDRLIGPMMAELPPFGQPVEDLKELPNLIDSITFGVATQQRLETNIIMTATSPDAAEDAKEIITNGLEYFRAFMITEMKRNLDMEDPVQVATVQYATRIWDKYEVKLIPTVQGRKLTITVHEEIMALPMLMPMLAVGTREIQTSQLMSTKNRARQLALGVLNYESAYRKFPPHTVYNDAGKAMYSGRVMILPFLEQSNLYEQFDRDKSWDSDANRDLGDTRVPTYDALRNRGVIRLPVFPGSIWDNEDGIGIGEITDGTSNTILGIEAAPDEPINWADPTPWKISEANPMKDVFGKRDKVIAVMADASVVELKRSEMTNERLRALLTRNGGEIVSLDR